MFNMRKLQIAFLILFSMLVGGGHAADSPPMLPEGSYNLQMEVFDSESSNPLSAHVISLLFSGEGGDLRSVQLISESGRIKNALEAGSWKLIASIDLPATHGNDYFGMAQIQLAKDANLTLFMMPVGSVSGLVLFENRTVSDAALLVRCPSGFYDMGKFYENVKSDRSGSFAMNSLPAKNCELFAYSNGRSGSVKINLQRGEFRSIQISLSNKAQVEERYETVILLIAAFFLVAIVVYKIWLRQKGQGKKQIRSTRIRKAISAKLPSAKSAETKVKVTQKMGAIMGTLNGNERRILEFIIKQDGRTRQNRIYYALLIPKVTLSRAIFSLESKNIIKSHRIGKVKEIELTEWFLD